MTSTIEVPISLIKAGDMDAIRELLPKPSLFGRWAEHPEFGRGIIINENTIRELLDASTPGPWKLDPETDGIKNSAGNSVVRGDAYCDGDEVWLEWRFDADPALAALAPELATEVLRLHEALSAWIEDERAAETAIHSAYGLGDTTTTHTTIINRINSILNGDTNA